MELEEELSEERWTKPMPFTELTQSSSFNDHPFVVSDSQQHEQNCGNSSIVDNGARLESLFSTFSQTSRNLWIDQNKITNADGSQKKQMLQNGKSHNWDPRAMLSNLSFLEQKIHQLEELVHIIVGRRGQVSVCADELVTQQQQLITADLTSVIVQLISTAGSLLPSVENSFLATNPSIGQTGQSIDQKNQLDPTGNCGAMEHNYNCMEDDELKDEDDANDEEHLPPGSYEILQLEKEEILASHTHFCTVCGKGFKRDANLRMHMRGHGDEYKTPAALAKPHKDSNGSEPVLLKRYSCPFMGCKRNKDHKKFQPLKSILCVKNHYKRTHCDKTYTCSRCNTKKFSVIADLKTHEKHCGRDKWLCSCGTTFSRKDKLFGHIAFFQGHTPAIPLEASMSSSSNIVVNVEASGNKVGNGSGIPSIMDLKGNTEETCFSLMGFDGFNNGELQEFSQSALDFGTSFPFPLSMDKNGIDNADS